MIIFIIYLFIYFLESEKLPHLMALCKENQDLELSSNSHSRWWQLQM